MQVTHSVRALLLGLAIMAAVPLPGSAESMLLIEADSGKVLQADNATIPWYPASTTKLLTTYVTLQAVTTGRLTFDTLLTVSPNAAAQQPSKMGFRVGTQLTVDNALKMLLVHSANDMAVVLAEGVSGSIEKFADEMNATSQRLGMTQSSWVNPNGLPADGQITSARDMAILARALIRDFPQYDFYWHIPAIRLGKRVMRNYNTLIGRYPGADGMKTGFICASGFNLVATATRNNRRLIAVVFGAPSSPVRAAQAAAMLEHGFNGNGLNWLMPSLGTVENLKPVNVDPPNLRDEVCGKHRRRPAAEEADNDEEAGHANGDNSSPQGFLLSNLKGASPKPSSLIGPLVETEPPIPVFVGPPKGTAVATAPSRAVVNAARAAARKPVAASLAVPPTGKPKSAVAAKPTDVKYSPAATTTKPAKPAARIAAKPAPVTDAKPAAKPKPKPTTATVKPAVQTTQ
jgi:D-alanyl-D-alanine carboxypeptidase